MEKYIIELKIRDYSMGKNKAEAFDAFWKRHPILKLTDREEAKRQAYGKATFTDAPELTIQ